MDTRWQPQTEEPKIAKFWQKGKFFEVDVPKSATKQRKKTFSILLPLPNANDSMHIGHCVFVIEDIMCRFHRMLGEPTLWLPGADHAGIETQYVFEKELKKKDKSRFDFDRETLYKMICDFVEENRKVNKFQLNRLGFGFDWRRYHYSLEPKIVEKVMAMFRKLHQDGLVYRGERIVNYCTKCGTAFSDLEVDYVERQDSLYYMKYGPFTLATTRPETKFGDAAVAVNPKDKRYKHLVGTEFIYKSLIGPRKMRVIADELVDPEFGTGAVKVTPAHDPNDFEMAQKHGLSLVKVIGLDGRLNKLTGRFAGLKINEARKKVVEELLAKGEMVKIDDKYVHRVGICYRCGTTIEPMVTPQWFIKMKPLAEKAIKAAKSGETKFFPTRFKKTFLEWLYNIRDWNISRQIVWGPRIPVWYCLDCNENIQLNFLDKKGQFVSGLYKDLKDKYSFEEIKKGLQSLNAPVDAKYTIEGEGVAGAGGPPRRGPVVGVLGGKRPAGPQPSCGECGKDHILQESDTFDTWFLSGQWPLTTLGFDIENPKKSSPDFKYFYPTSVLDTLWDILFFWVAKMIMLGIYATGKSPFKLVHLHARVVDKFGKKMSKSKGNVANPIDLVDKYGADALRLALVYGIAPASDIPVDEKKVEAMRNFCNKVWNAARFILINLETRNSKLETRNKSKITNSNDQNILKSLNKITASVTKNIEKHHYGQALEQIYQFFWHDFCDKYIESVKDRKEEAMPILVVVLATSLKLLHPFAPFVTEAVYQEFKKVLPDHPYFKEKSLATSCWPKIKTLNSKL